MMKVKIRLFDNGLEGPRFTWNKTLVRRISEVLQKLKKERKRAYIWRVWEEVRKDRSASETRPFWLMARVYRRYTVRTLEAPAGKDLILRIETR